MEKKTIEVNNGRKINLQFAECSVVVSKIDSNGKIERCYQIEDGEIIMLLNLYQRLRQKGEKSAYILNDFTRTILKDTGADDFVEEYQIIQ